MRKALIFLGILDDTDIDWIVRNGSKERVADGTVLIREGDPVDYIYFILDGEFKITTGHDKTEIARLRSGEILGEMSFVDSRPPSATVTATRESMVGVVDRSRLQQRLEVDIRFAARFYRAIAVLLSGRLRTTVSNLGYGEPDQDDEDKDPIASYPLGKLSLVATRLTEMQTRPWGDQ